MCLRVQALALLTGGGALADAAAADKFREKARARYAHATAFGGGAEGDVPGGDATEEKA